jgi:hypothetical protein
MSSEGSRSGAEQLGGFNQCARGPAFTAAPPAHLTTPLAPTVPQTGVWRDLLAGEPPQAPDLRELSVE